MYTEYQRFKKKSVGKGKLLPTPGDIEGPFYKEGAPFVENLVDVPTIHLFGSVTDELGVPIIGAELDFWQADEKGKYSTVGYNFRGRVIATDGKYHIGTVRPGDYQIGEHEFRCAHIHVKITSQGYKSLTTQLYFTNDPYNATDHWFDSRRIVGDVGENAGKFDFVLEVLS